MPGEVRSPMPTGRCRKILGQGRYKIWRRLARQGPKPRQSMVECQIKTTRRRFEGRRGSTRYCRRDVWKDILSREQGVSWSVIQFVWRKKVDRHEENQRKSWRLNTVGRELEKALKSTSQRKVFHNMLGYYDSTGKKMVEAPASTNADRRSWKLLLL